MMRPEAIQTIKDEHSAISAVLYSLRYLVRDMRNGGAPNFQLLHAILDYIVSYPDRWHHPKEDNFLFTAVQRRTQAADTVIAELQHQHKEGYQFIEKLKTLLSGYQNGDKDADQQFFSAVDSYVEEEWKHMRQEEDVLMPLAEKFLTAEDWREIDKAFNENDNPLFGIKPKEEAELLYQRILELAPAPIGYR